MSNKVITGYCTEAPCTPYTCRQIADGVCVLPLNWSTSHSKAEVIPVHTSAPFHGRPPVTLNPGCPNQALQPSPVTFHSLREWLPLKMTASRAALQRDEIQAAATDHLYSFSFLLRGQIYPTVSPEMRQRTILILSLLTTQRQNTVQQSEVKDSAHS